MTEPSSDARAGRLAKLERINATGGLPYRFERDATTADLHAAYPGLPPGTGTGRWATVAGRVMLHRRFGKLQFVTLQDGTGRIQLLADRSVLGEEGLEGLSDLDLGDWAGATGEVITTRKGELSIRVEELTMLAKSLRPLPEKWHGLRDRELRSRRRYLDLIVNEEARRVALTRVLVVAELRSQFQDRGFVEVETPVLQVQPGGAMARPFATHHHALDLDMYLRIATELHLKRLVVGGLERVFEVGRIFRNEGIDATHTPEFTMLEAYQAFADYRDIMELVEQVIAAVVERVTGGKVVEYQGRALDFTPPWPRLPYLQAVNEKLEVEVGFDMPLEELTSMAGRFGVEAEPGWGPGRIIAELFERHVEDTLWGPVLVVDHPREISPLARQHRLDPNLVERFEPIVAGAELGNAFSELNDPIEQRRRFEEQARARAAGDEEAHPIDSDYLLALEYGLPPTGGLGIGVDRLVMLLTDQTHIREVILFPHLRPE
ncbi:MAG: lysine--tRNA ligase [Acidimicrobiia bacterium]